MAVLRYVIGKYKLLWGWCPSCNSDAPEVYTCQVCKFERSQDRTVEAVWQRFADRGFR